MSTETPSKLHSLRRTSPLRTPFVGTCMLCGQEGLTFKDIQTTECENVRGLTPDEAVLDAIDAGSKTND